MTVCIKRNQKKAKHKWDNEREKEEEREEEAEWVLLKAGGAEQVKDTW